jgi:lysophospholipase L1-like esterase
VEGLYADADLPTLRTLTADGVILATLGDSNTAAEPAIGTATVAKLTDVYGVTPVYRINTAIAGDRLTVEWNPETDPNGRISGTIALINARLAVTPSALVVVSMMLGTNDPRNVRPTVLEFGTVAAALAQVFTSRGWLFVIHTMPHFPVSEGSAVAADVDLSLAYRLAMFDVANDATIFVGDRAAYYYTYQHPELMVDSGVHLTAPSQLYVGNLQADALRQSALAAVSTGGGSFVGSAYVY